MSITWMCDKLCSYEGIDIDVGEVKERPPFLKDYGAIIHRYGFRRLSNKTQVYLNPLNDFPRTRLTHSVEVEQIGRELSRYFSESMWENLSFPNDCSFNEHEFKTNFEDLVAASCLAHDIGQAPFGHKGEQTLNSLMSQEKVDKINCFEANKQNVRVLLGCKARKPYGVSCALVDAVMKYKSSTFHKKSKYPGHYSFESKIIDRVVSLTCTEGVRHPVCYLMEAADDIAYITSDLQDSLKINLIGKEDIYNILKDVDFPNDLPDVEIKSWKELIDYAFSTGDFDKLTSSLLKLMLKAVKSNIKHLFNNHSKGGINDLPAIMHDFFSVDNCSLNILYFGYGGIYEKIKRNGSVAKTAEMLKSPFF